MKYIVSGVLIFLCSCGLISKFDYGQHRYFNRALTKIEIQEINEKGRILKEWAGTNNNGDSLTGLILVANGKPFNFVEVGEWRETSLVKSNSKIIGWLKKELKYDSLGNLISVKSYFKKEGSNSYFLDEKMESAIHVSDDGFKTFEQIFSGFYESGELQYQVKVKVYDFEDTKSDKLKDKEVVEPVKYFDKKGNQIPNAPPDPYRGVVKFTKMKKAD